MKPSRRLHLEAVVLQPFVDRIHLLFTLLHESDVETAGILDVGSATDVHQGEYQPVVVDENGYAVIVSRDAPRASWIGIAVPGLPEGIYECVESLDPADIARVEPLETTAPPEPFAPGM